MNQTFQEKYAECKTWQEKSTLISLYHTLMLVKYSDWIIHDTALHFRVSVGLVSENIRLAKEIDNNNKKIIDAKTREEALKLLDKRRYISDRIPTVYKEEE